MALEAGNGDRAEKVTLVQIDGDREKLHGQCDLDIVEEKVVDRAQQALYAGNLATSERRNWVEI